MSEIRQAVGRSQSRVLSIACVDRTRARCVGHRLWVRAAHGPRVNVRWSPEVDDRQRATLEARFHLTQGEFKDRAHLVVSDCRHDVHQRRNARHAPECRRYSRDRSGCPMLSRVRQVNSTAVGLALLFGFGTSTLACIGVAAVRRLPSGIFSRLLWPFGSSPSSPLPTSCSSCIPCS